MPILKGMDVERKLQPPFVQVPLWPVITPMIAGWCAMLDISLIVLHAVTNGRYPSLECPLLSLIQPVNAVTDFGMGKGGVYTKRRI
jgi:hypothetical protein